MPRRAKIETIASLETAPAAAPTLKKNLKPPEFWAATAAYQPRDATQYHLYRLFPKIDRSLTGHEKNVLDIQNEMDGAYVLRTHGSGHYQIFFIDANAKPSQLSRCVLELEVEGAPPILDQREVVRGHPKNVGYIDGLRARGQWVEDSARGEDTMQNNAASAAVAEMALLTKTVLADGAKPRPADLAQTAAIEIMGNAYKSAAAVIAANKPAGDGGASGEMFRYMAQKMDQQHEMMMVLLKDRATPAPVEGIQGQLSIVSSMIEFADKLGSRGSAAPGWADQLPALLTGLLPLLVRGAQAPVAAAPGSGLHVVAPAAAGVSGPLGPAVGPAASSDEGEMMRFGLPPEAVMFMRIGKRALASYRDGYSGSAFAQLLVKTEGVEVYNSVAAVGAEGLVSLLRSLPPVLLGDAVAVIQDPQLTGWLADFEDAFEEDAPAGPADPGPVAA